MSDENLKRTMLAHMRDYMATIPDAYVDDTALDHSGGFTVVSRLTPCRARVLSRGNSIVVDMDLSDARPLIVAENEHSRSVSLEVLDTSKSPPEVLTLIARNRLAPDGAGVITFNVFFSRFRRLRVHQCVMLVQALFVCARVLQPEPLDLDIQ
jgi:hypothetical protein